MASRASSPLVVVVLNNDGGRLFELLPLTQSEVDPALVRDFFVTPQGVSFAGVAATFGIPFHLVHDGTTLTAALAEAHARPGATLIEARISGLGARARRTAFREAVRNRLSLHGG